MEQKQQYYNEAYSEFIPMYINFEKEALHKGFSDLIFTEKYTKSILDWTN